MSAIDFIDAHTLPFFSPQASTGLFFSTMVVDVAIYTHHIGANAFNLVKSDLDWFIANGQGKKIYMSQVSKAATIVTRTSHQVPHTERLALCPIFGC